MGSRGPLVSLIAKAVNTDRVAELETGLSDVQAAVTGAAECKHEWPFVQYELGRLRGVCQNLV